MEAILIGYLSYCQQCLNNSGIWT